MILKHNDYLKMVEKVRELKEMIGDRDIDIEILSDISDKYTQIKEKSRKF